MSATTVARFRRKVGWKDLAWVTWRQHRLMLVGTGMLVLAGAALMALMGVSMAARDSTQISVLMFESMYQPANMLAACTMAYSALVAVFWAAPLLSREFEQRTQLLAWSQDVSAARWLAGKTLVLGGAAVALALVLGTAAASMVHQLDVTDGRQFFSPFRTPFFEVVPLLQVGYTLFAFALGLVISALSRRTVLSMGLTFGIFVVVRVCVGAFLRPYFQTPVRVSAPVGERSRMPVPDEALSVSAGMLDKAGNPVEFPRACQGESIDGRNGFYNCLRENGVVSNFRDFQPIERLGTFQLIEFGIFTGLAIALLLILWRLAGRMTRV